MHYLFFVAISVLAAIAPAQTTDLFDIGTIRTIEITAPSNWRTVMASNFATQTLIKVEVKIDGKVYKDVGARHRGFSTYYFLPTGKTDKRPWKLLFDEYVAGQKVQGYRTLNINNNVWDPSLMREVVGYEFMRRYMRAPKCCFVKLKVNNEDLGLFTNAEQINKDFLDEHFPDNDGNRYRGDRLSNQTAYKDTALTWMGTTLSRYQAGYTLKTENGKYTAWTGLINAINVLNNTPVEQMPGAIPKVIEVDNALRFIAVANMSAWLDSYLGRTCKNFYIYEDPFHGTLWFHPWDTNNGFGGLTDGLGTTGVAKMPVFHREVDTANPRPLFSQLVKIPKWRATYLAHMRTMLPEIDWKVIGKRIDELRKFIRPTLQADTKSLYTLQWFDDNVTKAINVGFVTTPGLQPFFEERFKFMTTETNMARVAPTLGTLTATPATPLSTQTTFVTTTISGVKATEATLYYRARGAWLEAPMFDDGKHGDVQANDGVWGGSIPPQPPMAVVEYYVSANSDLTTSTGAMALQPMTGSYRPMRFRVQGAAPAGPIVISEILTKNDNGIKDEQGEREDWIELTNIGSQSVSVSDMFVSDDATRPTKWKIPSGVTLQPGATALIWADDDGSQGPMHTSFKLSASGGELVLYAADGKTILDGFAYGPQLADISLGRLPGHLSHLVTFPVSTPNATNEPIPCGHGTYRGANPASSAFSLSATGTPNPGATQSVAIASAPASSPGMLYIGQASSMVVPGLGSLLLDPLLLFPLLPFQTDNKGVSALTAKIPNNNSLKGQRFYFQAAVVSSTQQILLSNGIATRICP